MIKIDFAEKTVQLWPNEYQEVITVSVTSLSFRNAQGVPKFDYPSSKLDAKRCLSR